jgi:hypothetical protein
MFFANSPCISDELDKISLFSEENFLSGVRRYRLNSPSFSVAKYSTTNNVSAHSTFHAMSDVQFNILKKQNYDSPTSRRTVTISSIRVLQCTTEHSYQS